MRFSLLALSCLVPGAAPFAIPTPGKVGGVTPLMSARSDDVAMWMGETAVAEPSTALGTVNDDRALTEIWENSPSIRIEGQSLRTWTIDHRIEQMHVSLSTEGRPLSAKIDLWHGPDYTPSHLKLYVEDGLARPFNAIVATPKNMNTIAIFNEASMEYPFDAVVEGDMNKASLNHAPHDLYEKFPMKTVQGGMITSYTFGPEVDSVEVLLKTDGRNLKARIELLTGPNNIKQVMDYYSSDGKKRPFYAVIQTPGAGNVVRIINENTVEYPFGSIIEPYIVNYD